MADQYQPKLTEIIGEMARSAKHTFRGENVKDFVTYAGIAAKIMIAGTNMYASVNRIGESAEDKHGPIYASHYTGRVIMEGARKAGFNTGIIAGGLFDVAECIGLAYAGVHGHPEAFLIPVATNIASVIHEKAKDARERLIERKKEEVGA